MVLIKIPTDEDLGGRFAVEYKMPPSYGTKELASDTLLIEKDTIRKK